MVDEFKLEISSWIINGSLVAMPELVQEWCWKLKCTGENPGPSHGTMITSNHKSVRRHLCAKILQNVLSKKRDMSIHQHSAALLFFLQWSTIQQEWNSQNKKQNEVGGPETAFSKQTTYSFDKHHWHWEEYSKQCNQGSHLPLPD